MCNFISPLISKVIRKITFAPPAISGVHFLIGASWNRRRNANGFIPLYHSVGRIVEKLCRNFLERYRVFLLTCLLYDKTAPFPQICVFVVVKTLNCNISSTSVVIKKQHIQNDLLFTSNQTITSSGGSSTNDESL